MSKSLNRPHPLVFASLLLDFASIGASWIENAPAVGALLLVAGCAVGLVGLRKGRQP